MKFIIKMAKGDVNSEKVVEFDEIYNFTRKVIRNKDADEITSVIPLSFNERVKAWVESLASGTTVEKPSLTEEEIKGIRKARGLIITAISAEEVMYA